MRSTIRCTHIDERQNRRRARSKGNMNDDREREDEEDVIGTISSLVGMLDDGDDGEGVRGKEDGEDNREKVLSKISNLITKIAENEDEGDVAEEEAGDFSSPPPPRTGRSSRKGTPSRRSATSGKVELPPYPTPFELWKKAHQSRRVGLTPLEKVNAIDPSDRNRRAEEVRSTSLRSLLEHHDSSHAVDAYFR